MFEKEAKKHKEEFITTYINVGGGLKAADMIGMQKEQSYQEGAEFGYNKANEWHFVKDGEYPTHSNRVLVFTDEGVGFGIYGLDNKKWYTYDTGFDVIAWKEITLPALPNEVKENEN